MSVRYSSPFPFDRGCLVRFGEEEVELPRHGTSPGRSYSFSRDALKNKNPAGVLESFKRKSSKCKNPWEKERFPSPECQNRVIQSEYPTEKTISEYLLGLMGKRNVKVFYFLALSFPRPLQGPLALLRRKLKIPKTELKVQEAGSAEQPVSLWEGLR